MSWSSAAGYYDSVAGGHGSGGGDAWPDLGEAAGERFLLRQQVW
jgi:hypothetical protein